MSHSNQIMIFIISFACIVLVYKLLTHFTNYGSLLDLFTSRQKLKYKRLFMYLKGYNKLIKLNDNNYYKYKKHIKTEFGFNLLYKAINTAPDVDMVLKEEDRIKDYLEINKSDKMLVSAKAHNLLIEFKIMPKLIKYDKSCFKKGYINFGYGFNGYHYTKISSLTHLLCAGKSGMGKSNLANYLIGSIMHSINEKADDGINELLTKFIFCDFKGGVESAKFERLNHSKIQTITEFSELDSTLIKLLEIMRERTKQIIDSQKLKQEHSAIMLFIDEFADVKAELNSTSPRDKEAYEQINRIDKNLQELLRKARFTNIKIILCLQRPHTENISSNTREGCQSKIMLNVDDATLVIGDNAKDLPKLGIDSTKLEKGEYYFIDAATNTNELLKCPYDESFEDGSYLFDILGIKKTDIKNSKTVIAQIPKQTNIEINNNETKIVAMQNSVIKHSTKPQTASLNTNINSMQNTHSTNNNHSIKTPQPITMPKQSIQNKQKYIHLKTANSANILQSMFNAKSSYIVKLGKSDDRKLNFGFNFNHTTLFSQNINKAQYDLIISLIENSGSKLYKSA